MRFIWCCLLLALLNVSVCLAKPLTFKEAKKLAREHIYHDQTQAGTFYCGCAWEWMGRQGGRIKQDSCGYKVRTDPIRGARLEWEHLVPASTFGKARKCWQKGGRPYCKKHDPMFNQMEGDLHNLVPVIGEINADRANYPFAELPKTGYKHGQCEFKVDFKKGRAEPRDEVKGTIARVYFYMHDQYGFRMSRAQQKLLLNWSSLYPPNEWELERDRRIKEHMGHSNPFVTGEKQWKIRSRNSKQGL